MVELNELLESISQILGLCILFGIAFLLIWFGAFLWGSELIYRQGQWFGLTPHECQLVAYGGMGFAKILILVFFLFPYLAIRLVLRKR